MLMLLSNERLTATYLIDGRSWLYEKRGSRRADEVDISREVAVGWRPRIHSVSSVIGSK